ncbi:MULTISPECIES: hypothetical protein [Nocardia]|uniref:hypothetical protein n=1 Tax=Nocardia TaxID=1817 RepID=UPI000D692238|nr:MULTISPECIES: hypothetical protein [Nocardia]
MLNQALADEFNEALALGEVLGDWTPDNACDVEYSLSENESGSHCFSSLDGIHCKHCDGYPFDFQHWCTG